MSIITPQAGLIFGQLFFILLLLGWVIAIWAIIDIMKSQFDGRQKWLWVIIVIFAPLGAVIYYFVGRKQRL